MAVLPGDQASRHHLSGHDRRIGKEDHCDRAKPDAKLDTSLWRWRDGRRLSGGCRAYEPRGQQVEHTHRAQHGARQRHHGSGAEMQQQVEAGQERACDAARDTPCEHVAEHAPRGQAGTEGAAPLTRLTPEVCFPEIEGWPKSSYANPWPLSERHYLVSWGNPGARHPGPAGWDRWHAVPDPLKDMGVFWFDAAGQLEPLYRDPDISCLYPIPVRPQSRPPIIADQPGLDGPKEGRFFLTDISRGLSPAGGSEIKQIRIVAVPPKTHPVMNSPNMGITADDPGKCVLGTVPVEPDGSAYFRAPSGLTLFFQALDARGMAVQTMRSAAYVQPGQTVGCVGCHEPRTQSVPVKPALAAAREPSKILAGPAGSWPYRFDRLVQPVLDQHCVACHSPGSKEAHAAKLDLTPAKSYDSLVRFGKPSLFDQVWAGYREGTSKPGEGLARRSALLAHLTGAKGHYDVKLDPDSLDRLVVWMDTYAQKLGAFSPDQERRLEELRRACAPLLVERPASVRTAEAPRPINTAAVKN